MPILPTQFQPTHHFNCISTSSTVLLNLCINPTSDFTRKILRHLGLADFTEETKPSCCACAKLACIRPLTQLTPRSQILKCWQTSSTGRLERKTEGGRKKKVSLLQALFVGSWYCHNNIWRPSCRFTELGCAFGWSTFPQMTLAGLLCEELTNL